MPEAGSAGSPRWYVNRLRCMSAAEVAHRACRALATRVESLRRPATASPSADFTRSPPSWLHFDAKVDAAACVREADRIAAGRYDLFALRDVALGSPPAWNRDPKTGIEVPLAFGKHIDYRDPRRVGDIKYLWELNRHAHLVTLARAWRLRGEPRHLDTLRLHLESWFEACPPGLGPNWSSALEAALRLIHWSIAWQWLGGAQGGAFGDPALARLRERWAASVYRHARFVDGFFSRHSSANNHLIGEAAGLYIAALTWPCWPAARGWLARATRLLEREALRQNAPDGVNREQATSYQQFVLDLLFQCLLAGRANERPLSPALQTRVEAMLEYLASIMDAGGHVPMFGDADDAVIAPLAPPHAACRFRSSLAGGALLFGRADFKAKAGALDDRTRWWFGAGADAAFAALDARAAALPVRRAFPQGGRYVMGTDFETAREIRLVVDAGPLGYPDRLAAHGHADALSFTLCAAGQELLIDPGTFAYHADPAWRAYFRGTAAHNTVRIDGLDQSTAGGNFLWLTRARADCERWSSTPSLQVFEGRHDGYRRLPDPVLHRRRIALRPRERRIEIVDELQALATHDVELFFHCHERCQVVEAGARQVVLLRAPTTLRLVLPEAAGASWELLRGSVAPIAGWVSRRYDVKETTTTIVWRARITGTTRLHCEIGL